MTKEAVVRARVTETMKDRLLKCLEHEGMTESDFVTSEVIRFVTEVETKMLTEKTGDAPKVPSFPYYPPSYPVTPGTAPVVPQSPYPQPYIGDFPSTYPSTICSTANPADTYIGDPPGSVGSGSTMTSTRKPKSPLDVIAGEVYEVLPFRVSSSNREDGKYYYELRHHPKNPNLPVSIEHRVGNDFGGTLITKTPIDLGEDGRRIIQGGVSHT